MANPMIALSGLAAGVMAAGVMMVSVAHAQTGAALPTPVSPVNQVVEIRNGFAVLVRMPSPVQGVIVGNPALVDAVPRSDRIIAIVGKATGATNVLMLDELGEAIANVIVTISGHEPAKVYLHSKNNVNEYWAYQCAPLCVRIGDPLEGAPPLPALPRGSIVNITAGPVVPPR